MWALDPSPKAWEARPPCSIWGQALDGDPDDQPWDAAGAVCGDCFRARELDQTLWELDLADPDDGLW
jgi:hypothetical protein